MKKYYKATTVIYGKVTARLNTKPWMIVLLLNDGNSINVEMKKSKYDKLEIGNRVRVLGLATIQNSNDQIVYMAAYEVSDYNPESLNIDFKKFAGIEKPKKENREN